MCAGEEWLPFSELPAMRDMVVTGIDNPAIEQLIDAIPEDSKPEPANNSTPFRPKK